MFAYGSRPASPDRHSPQMQAELCVSPLLPVGGCPCLLSTVNADDLHGLVKRFLNRRVGCSKDLTAKRLSYQARGRRSIRIGLCVLHPDANKLGQRAVTSSIIGTPQHEQWSRLRRDFGSLSFWVEMRPNGSYRRSDEWNRKAKTAEKSTTIRASRHQLVV